MTELRAADADCPEFLNRYGAYPGTSRRTRNIRALRWQAGLAWNTWIQAQEGDIVVRSGHTQHSSIRPKASGQKMQLHDIEARVSKITLQKMTDGR